MDEDFRISDDEDVVKVVDVHSIGSLLSLDGVEGQQVDDYNMTSLGAFMLLGKSFANSNNIEEENKLQRLSLAYERLHNIPKLLLNELAHTVQILDISHNEFESLDFLVEFKELTTLICDRNNVDSNTFIPHMPKLELLWMNHCKIASLYPWAKRLQASCPNLKYLSLMGNPVAPSYLNGGNFYEYLQYRYFIISLFPHLIHLDDKPVTDEQRKEATLMYPKPLMERLVQKTQASMPYYLQKFSTVISDVVTPTPPFALPQKNLII